MRVFTARIEVSDDFTWAEFEDAKLSAKWKEKLPGGMFKLPEADLTGKCGSCIFFKTTIGKKGGASKGTCLIGGNGYCRTYKACRKYKGREEQG